MVVYKITANGVTHYTKTGISIWKAVLDKFNIKYEIERTNDNDIPHSDIRRMESEGVYEEKFGEPNFSSVSGSDTYNHTYFHDEWNQSITEDIEVNYDWREEILKREFGGNNLKND